MYNFVLIGSAGSSRLVTWGGANNRQRLVTFSFHIRGRAWLPPMSASGSTHAVPIGTLPEVLHQTTQKEQPCRKNE
jgi:hypothetical protein